MHKLLISIFFLYPLVIYAGWDDAFKKENSEPEELIPKKQKKKEEADQLSHSKGMDIDITERINTSSKGEWFESLKPDSADMASKDEPKILKDLINALKTLESIMPDNMPEKAIALNNFAQGFFSLGDFERGETLSLRALRMTEKFKGPNSLETMYCLRTMALMYETLGEYERSKQMIEASLDILDKNKGINRGFLPALHANLSKFQLALGQIGEAEISANKALELAGERKDHVGTDAALLAIANVYKTKGNYVQAKYNYKNALELIKKQYLEDKNTPNQKDSNGSLLAYCYLSLIELCIANQDIDEAEELFKDSKDIFEEQYLGILTGDSVRYLAAQIIFENLKGNQTAAKNKAKEYIEYQNKTLPSALEMVEKQRLSWQKQNLSLSIPILFAEPDVLAECVISWKGIVLDSLIADRKNLKAVKNKESEALANKLASLKRQLAQIQLNNSKDKDPNYIKFIKNQIYSTELQISKLSKTNFIPKNIANLKSIQGALKDNEVLLEFVTYRDFPDIYLGAKKMGVIAIFKNNPPQWFDLGKEDMIASKIKIFQSIISSPQATNSELESCLKDLHALLIEKPQISFPKSVTNLLVSPDGVLNFLPFACLIDNGNRFLAETKEIYYLGSGRDLLKSSAIPQTKKMRIFANPTFVKENLETPNQDESSVRISTNIATVSLPPLPGTEVESQKLEKIGTDLGWHVESVKGMDATEENLVSSNATPILHLATHGFFLGNNHSNTQKKGDRGMSLKPATESEMEAQDLLAEVDPMQLSGIALTGAQNTFNAWAKGQAPNPSSDGILTAEEVVSLNLEGTWLVSLSACETGVGEAKAGEGVFGLRRSFVMAGAQNLLMTLWPVDDANTAEVMSDFYKSLFTGGNPPKALSETQKYWLMNLRQSNGLLDAVRKAGPFVMATTGQPKSN